MPFALVALIIGLKVALSHPMRIRSARRERRRLQLFIILIFKNRFKNVWPARGLKVAQRGLKVSQRGLKVSQRGLKVAQRGLKVAQRGLKVAQRGLKVAQRGLKVAQRGLKVAQRGLKVALKNSQFSLVLLFKPGNPV